MAQVSELTKLNRKHLNEFATRNGVEDADSLEKYKTKADLAEVVSPKVTPEQLAEFRVEMGYDEASTDDKAGDVVPPSEQPKADAPGEVTSDTPVVTPNSAPPKEGESQIVDRSAPADDNIEEIKSGERADAPDAEAATVQPGDPKVKSNEGGIVTERDATKDELDKVDTSGEPEHVTEDETTEDTTTDETELTEAQKREEANDFGGEHGQAAEGDEPVEEPTVKLKNPSGRVVDVRVSDIAHQKMFAAGFETIEGEEYDDDVIALEDAYKNNLQARTIYNDVDQSDPHQSMSKGDVARRAGTKETGESDGQPQAKVAAPKNAAEPKTFDGVDKRENGQVVSPKTNNPLKSNRLSQALNK